MNKIYGTKEAVIYLKQNYVCRMSIQGLKYHIYKGQNLKADGKLGHSLYFLQSTLDAFAMERYPRKLPIKATIEAEAIKDGEVLILRWGDDGKLHKMD